MKGLESHVVEFAERHSYSVQLARFLVLTVAQFHLQFTALTDVAVFAVQSTIPAQFLGAVSVGGSLYGRFVKSDLAENRTRQADGGWTINLAHFNPQVLHSLAWSAWTIVYGVGFVLELG